MKKVDYACLMIMMNGRDLREEEKEESFALYFDCKMTAELYRNKLKKKNKQTKKKKKNVAFWCEAMLYSSRVYFHRV